MLSQSTQISITLGLVLALVIVIYALTRRLDDAHRKLDIVLGTLDGLRNYLYEIDPQFDDERKLDTEADQGRPMAEYDHLQLVQQKKSEGRRTLNSRFFDSST